MNLGRLFLAQKGLCFHCGDVMAMGVHSRQCRDGYTRDHLVPVCDGGRNFRNIVLAHSKCNNRRGDRMPTDDMLRRCEQIWDEASRPPAKLVRTALMRMGWKGYRRNLKRQAQVAAQA